jgi:DNA polymerase III gamma/tau subunit
MHLEINFISPVSLISHFLKDTQVSFSQAAYNVIISILHSPTEIKNTCKLIKAIYNNKKYEIQEHDIVNLISAPSFKLCIDLLKAYIMRDEDKLHKTFIELWATGISYEDFLHEINLSITTIGIISAVDSQKIHQILLRGWIYFAQGKTHTLDMMRLFLD